MAEPIDPQRWKQPASKQWRLRFAGGSAERGTSPDDAHPAGDSPGLPSPDPVPLPLWLATQAEASGGLTEAHVVAIVVRASRCLVELHQVGRSHGSVELGAFVVTSDGEVRLRDILPAGGDAHVAGDIGGLLEILAELTQDSPISGELALARLRLHRGVRSAADIVTALEGLAADSLVGAADNTEADPVQTQETAAAPGSSPVATRQRDERAVVTSESHSRGPVPALPPARVSRGRSRGRLVGAVTAAVFGCALICAALLTPRSGAPAAAVDQNGASASPRSASPAATTLTQPMTGFAGDRAATAASAEPDWIAVLVALDQRRLNAFATADARQLDSVNIAGSSAMTTDAATLAELTKRQVKPIGLATQVDRAVVRTRSATAVTLDVVDHRSGFDLVDRATGVLVRRERARGAQRWTVRLVRPGAEWLVAEVVAGSPERGRGG